MDLMDTNHEDWDQIWEHHRAEERRRRDLARADLAMPLLSEATDTEVD